MVKRVSRKNPIDAAREAYEKALAGIHIDIGSHNTKSRAKNPKRAARRSPVKRAVRKANPQPAVKPSMVARYWVHQEHAKGKEFVCACKVKQTAEVIAALLQKMAQPGVKFTVQRVY